MTGASLVMSPRGVSDSVFLTLLKERKTSSKVYHLTLKTYFAWCEVHKFHPQKYVVRYILDFLQSGVEISALSTIKGQILALAILFQRPIVSHSLVKAIVQDVIQIVLFAQLFCLCGILIWFYLFCIFLHFSLSLVAFYAQGYFFGCQYIGLQGLGAGCSFLQEAFPGFSVG